ncbi:hypothetical protein HanIR_Chr05g0255611 [Helianthus annuus]|nr:hypothetical protein HanIR_Chr05g0255611 [Helianthus annuus]
MEWNGMEWNAKQEEKSVTSYIIDRTLVHMAAEKGNAIQRQEGINHKELWRRSIVVNSDRSDRYSALCSV